VSRALALEDRHEAAVEELEVAADGGHGVSHLMADAGRHLADEVEAGVAHPAFIGRGEQVTHRAILDLAGEHL